MLNAELVKNAKFSKSMGGYKQEEVDILLDKVESDYSQFERIIEELKSKIETLETENNELKASQSSIQNVLLSAQRLADRIVNEAKEKSEEIIQNAESNISVITAKEKELSATFELKASERKSQLEKELSDMVDTANKKAESITAAANDSVARQQMLFDKLKLEIAAFKSSISAKYKEHIELLSTIPDTVEIDPKNMAAMVMNAFEKAPDPQDFIVKNSVEDEEDFEKVKEIENVEGFSVKVLQEEEITEEQI